MVSKVFEKLVNNSIVDHLEKCHLFSDFQYGFRSSRSTADLLTVVSDRIARAFNMSGATRAVALDISKAFDRVLHAGLLNKLKSYGISGQIFGLIYSFLSNRQLQVVLDGKFSQEYSVNAGVPEGSILGPTLFLLYINDLRDDVICNIAIYANDTTPKSKCDQASDLWQQLELDSELESDLRDTVHWDRKWLVDFNAGKIQLVSFDESKNTGAIDVKMDASVLEEKTSFKMLGLTFYSKLDWCSYIVSIAKTASKKIGALIHSMKFFLLRLLCISINLPYDHVWNTVAMSGLVLLVATWNCWISYRNGYVGLLVLLWLPLLNPWLIVEMNSLPTECLPLTYDLSGFKSRINRYLLIVGSF